MGPDSTGFAAAAAQLDPREIETMKTQPGKDLIIFGSGSIVS
jgi:hypothetical protein